MRGRTAVRRALVSAAGVVALGAPAAPVAAAPTPTQASNAFVEVTPNTAQAGSRVNIRASCDQANNNQAIVESQAFNRVVVRPNNGFLTGQVTIPGNRAPGTFDVNLTCPNGNTAHTTLTVVNMSKPTQGPATGGGGTAGGFGGPMVLAGGLAVVVIGGGLWLMSARRRPETRL
ncbi:hypothetical protein ACIBF5_24930 [Micromonospora sp. NPDC050417]|uniref:hypothetical protein n=1 Tax=Micromonospora sp. NPDC050417 TaxID=3364280 RepID=UPI0037923899